MLCEVGVESRVVDDVSAIGVAICCRHRREMRDLLSRQYNWGEADWKVWSRVGESEVLPATKELQVFKGRR